MQEDANKKNQTRGIMFASTAVTAWGINAVILKYLSEHMSISLLNASRIIFASFIFIGIVLARNVIDRNTVNNKQIQNTKLSLRTWLSIAGLGFIGTSLYQLLFLNGIKLSNASVATLVGSTNPVWVALLVTIFFKQQLTRNQSYGIPITMIGVVLLSWQSVSSANVKLLGVLFLVASNILWAIYTVGSRQMMKQISPIEFTAFSFVLGGTPFVLVTLPAWADATRVPAQTWLLVLFAALISQVIGFLTWFAATSMLGASRVSIFLNITPLVGVTLAVLFLNESITISKVLAGAIILLGVWLANKQ